MKRMANAAPSGLISTILTDIQQVSVAGGSEGGSIALGVASKVDDIYSVLVLNAGSSSFQHDIEYSIRQTVASEEVDECWSVL